MADTAKVAAAQLGPASADRQKTVARIVGLVEAAAAAGVELVVFPELALTEYFGGTYRADITGFLEAALPSEGTRPVFAAIGARGSSSVVLPYAELAGAAAYNSAALIDPGGTVVGRYRKVHVPGEPDPAPDAEGGGFEKLYFRPGDLGFPVYPTAVGPVGMAICYDRRFPETFRCLALGGAEIMTVSYNTPHSDEVFGALANTQANQELLVRGAAVANGVPVIASGKAGVENGTRYSGGSCIVDHLGNVVAKARTDGDELVTSDLDLGAARRFRERVKLVRDRRPDAYQAMGPVAAG